jgi:hypothetical protein
MFRRYEGKWQRFAQADPYDGSYDISDPQSINRYAYVGNDPVNFIDPSGLLPNDQCPTDGTPCYIYTSWAERITDSFGADRGLSAGGFGGVDRGGRGGGGGGRGDTGGGGNEGTPQQTDPTFGLGDPPSMQDPAELIHCNKDVRETIDKIFNLSRSSGGRRGTEYGFRVDKINGQYKVSELFTSSAGQHVTISGIVPGVTVAVIHTHPSYDPNPSPGDMRNANNNGKYTSYVKTFGGLKLYNARIPKDSSGRDRIIDAPKCSK